MKFERINKYPDAQLPERATTGSAGYDFFVAEDITVPPGEIVLVPTGVKAQIDSGYWLELAVRSSTPRKLGLILANGIGIVDSDYYNNPDNEGHIMFQVYNIRSTPVNLYKGLRIGQGVFVRYGLTDDDNVERIRTGGFGSTNQELSKVINEVFNSASQYNTIPDSQLKEIFGNIKEREPRCNASST